MFFSSGETPLHIAVVYNDINSVKLLIKHGVDVNKRVVGDFNISERNGFKDETSKGKRIKPQSLLQRKRASQKFFDPQSSNPESKNFFLDDWKPSISFQGHAYFGEYPLAFAAAFGHIEIYDYLIDHGADPNMQDSYGNTVLHVLVIRNRMVYDCLTSNST